MKSAMLTMLLAVLVAPASAQDGGDRLFRADMQHLVHEGDRDEAFAAKALGELLYLRVTLDERNTPARDVIDTIRDALTVPLVARYDDDALGYGLDPTAPITISFDDVPVLDAIEAVLAEIAVDTTWQIRRGFVEIGTKERLQVPAAHVLRLYDVGDLLLDIPDFDSADNPFGQPGINLGGAGPAARSETKRRYPEELALDLVEVVVETIEPGEWDYGQISYDDPEDIGLLDSRVDPSTDVDPDVLRRSPHYRRYVPPAKPASIRYWRRLLMVRAPDYFHRQIGGYPDPIVPAGIAASDLPSGSMRQRVEDRPHRWFPDDPEAEDSDQDALETPEQPSP